MRENYFKSFFKSFGFFPLILAIAGVIGVGYATLLRKVSTPEFCKVASAAILFASGGFALLGFSGLKREQISFNDFIRVVFLVSSIVLGIFAFTAKPIKIYYGSGFMACALAFCIQIIIRLLKCVNGDPNRSYKYYFGALAGQFNPIVILIIGLVIAVLVIILGNFVQPFNTFIFGIRKYKNFVLGACGALVLLTFISASIDRDTEATFFDFILAIIFVASLALALFAVTTNTTSYVFKNNPDVLPTYIKNFGPSFSKYTVVIAGSAMASLLLRSMTYTKEKSYVNSMHKTRTYFKSVYDKYDLILPFIFVVGSFVLVAVSLSVYYTKSDYFLIRLIFDKMGAKTETKTLIFAIIPSVLLICGVVLSLIYHKFTSQEVVRVDKVLPYLLYTSIVFVIFGLLNVAFGFNYTIPSLIILIVGAIVFVYAFIVQIIRLKSYNPIAAYATANTYSQTYNKEEEKPVEEEAKEEPAEEEPVEEEETDPFGLTEEDEAIYEAIYGKDEEAQEEPVEETQEVVEETEEEPTEEEAVEETQEVVEEVQEEESDETEDEAEDEEAEDEVEEEETEEEPTEEEASEEEPIIEEKKESNIVIQEFQVVDENGEPKKIKRRFNTKMMFAPYETKEYYNEIKNYLTMYRAKSRASARCETYRYKGLVAKVALGGKSVKVFLALDTAIIEENPKYHLKDFSEKKQYQEVPVMIKVRSPRSLKYFKELVDIMMANRGVKPKRNFEPTDYMPQLIPNGEAILASLGMSTYYLQNTMNVKGIPDEMPDDLEEYIPMIAGDPLDDEEIEANVYLDTLCQHFEDGAEITIDTLKSMHIVTRGNVIHIKARGTLDRKLIIYAEYFDSDALKMLMCTNGTAVKIVR